jgi:hypothetical protein
MKHNKDTKAILARREAFVKSVLKNSELDEARAGELADDPLSIGTCLTILPTNCLSPANVTEDLITPQTCFHPG